MPTRTISVTLDADDKLSRARRYPSESEDTITAAELLSRLVSGPAPFTADGLDAVDRAKAEQRAPANKWNDPSS